MNIVRTYSEHSDAFLEYLGGHSIASYISKFDFRAKVFSCDVIKCKEIINNEILNHNVKIIGFYVGADTVIMISHVIQWLKFNYKNVKVMVGGAEAYSLDENFLRDTNCDYIIYGEGELPVLNLLRYEIDGIGDKKSIMSLKFIDENGNYIVNPLEKLIYNLDEIPFPDKNNSLDKSFRTGDTIGILTGRGCPFKCSFCFEGAASKIVRLRSIENVISEIENVKKYNHALKYVNIYDDTFTLNTKRLREFCDYMKNTDLFWTCEGHVLTLYKNPEMLNIMSDSGLIAMQIGIESGSEKVLKAYNKKITPEMTIEVVKNCKSAGLLRVEGNYIIGGAFENEITLQESIEHSEKLIEAGRGIIELNTVFFAPYYGTAITKNPALYGLKNSEKRFKHTIM